MLKWIVLEVVENCGEVSLACVWEKSHNHLVLVLWEFGQFCCCIGCRTRGNAYEHTFSGCEFTAGEDCGIIGCLENLIYRLTVEYLRDESCSDTLNLVSTWCFTAEHG